MKTVYLWFQPCLIKDVSKAPVWSTLLCSHGFHRMCVVAQHFFSIWMWWKNWEYIRGSSLLIRHLSGIYHPACLGKKFCGCCQSVLFVADLSLGNISSSSALSVMAKSSGHERLIFDTFFKNLETVFLDRPQLCVMFLSLNPRLFKRRISRYLVITYEFLLSVFTPKVCIYSIKEIYVIEPIRWL